MLAFAKAIVSDFVRGWTLVWTIKDFLTKVGVNFCLIAKSNTTYSNNDRLTAFDPGQPG